MSAQILDHRLTLRFRPLWSAPMRKRRILERPRFQWATWSRVSATTMCFVNLVCFFFFVVNAACSPFRLKHWGKGKSTASFIPNWRLEGVVVFETPMENIVVVLHAHTRTHTHTGALWKHCFAFIIPVCVVFLEILWLVP